MANIVGTSGSDNLFGTNSDDIILGSGGTDFIQGNGGADFITGFGSISGNAGSDTYNAVAVSNSDTPEFAGTGVDLGNGNDTLVINFHDEIFNEDNYGIGNYLLGSGSDTAIVSGDLGDADVMLGAGRDKAYVLARGAAKIFMGETPFSGIADQHRDIIFLDGHYDADLHAFGQNDKIALFDTTLTYSELRLRTSFYDENAKTNLKITLPNGAEIQVFKSGSAHLTADNFRLSENTLKVVKDVRLDHEQTLTKALFLSGADETVKAKGKALFLGDGNDTGEGNGQNDNIFGEGGDDTLIGKKGNDRLEGGYGDDRIFGGLGNDTILTGAGADRVFAGAGSDEITIARGASFAHGGGGRDTFIFTDAVAGDTSVAEFGGAVRAKGGRGVDTFSLDVHSGSILIEDFRPAREKIDLTDWFQPGTSASSRKSSVEFMIDRIATVEAATSAPGITGIRIDIGRLDLYLEGLNREDFTIDNFIF